MRRPTCFRGPARAAAHEMWRTNTCYYYCDEVRPTHEATHGLARAETQAGPCTKMWLFNRRGKQTDSNLDTTAVETPRKNGKRKHIIYQAYIYGYI